MCGGGQVLRHVHTGHSRDEQALERRAITTGQVGDVAAVDLEQHLGGGVSHLPGDPFGVLAGGQPEGGGRMPGLVRAPGRGAEIAQQRVPHALGDVVVIQRLALAVAKHPVLQSPGARKLPLEGLKHDLAHLHVTVGLDGLGLVFLARHEGFANENEAAREVDILPLEPVDLSGAQSGKNTHGVVIPVILAHGREQRLDLVEGEGLHVALGDLERFDVVKRTGKLVAVGGFKEDSAQDVHHCVDSAG